MRAEIVGAVAGRGAVHGVAGGVERRLELRRERRFVLDDQDPHPSLIARSAAERELNARIHAAVQGDGAYYALLNFWTYDFGYSWPFTRGHLLVFLLFGAVAALCHLARLAALGRPP